MNWQDVLKKLQEEVPVGKITTYKELAQWAFGKPTGTQAVVAMLKAAVNADYSNREYTNRVVSESGKLTDPNGQTVQLFNEGIPMEKARVKLKRADVVRFNQ